MAFLRRPRTIMLFSFAAVIAMAALVSFSFYQSSLEAANQGLKSELSAISRSVSAGINSRSFFNLFIKKANKLSPEAYYSYLKNIYKTNKFKQFKKQLAGFIKSHKTIGFDENNIYLFNLDPYDKSYLCWAVMAHKKSFTGERYLVRDAMKPLLQGEKSFSNTNIYLSEASHKRWISSYSVIQYKNKAIGIVEVALEVNNYYKQIKNRISKMVLIIIMVGFFAFVFLIMIFRFIKTITKKNHDLILEQQKTRLSEKKYKNLTEASEDIIFSVDYDGNILSVNKAIKKHLQYPASGLINENLFSELFDKADSFQSVDRELFMANWQQFLSDKSTTALSLSLYHKVTREPIEFQLRIQDNDGSALIKATYLLEDNLSRSTLAEKATYKIENYLTMAESIALKITFSLSRYANAEQVREVKVAIRELILNAIEHGNLNITFEEKSKAQLEDNYLELIEARRLDKDYRDRYVTIEYLINAKQLAIRISDEGQGFDHKAYLEKKSEDLNTEGLAHGRGIKLAQQVFDSVKYNKEGNSVYLVKKN